MPELPASLTPDEWAAVNNQRVITTAINRDVVKVGATYLRPTSKVPVSDNWAASKYLDTNLQDWIDNELFRYSGVGFNLQQGWVDIDIDADDTEYNRCIHQAMIHVGIDCRLAFGRRSAGAPKHFLVQLSEEESRSFEEFKKFEPKPIRISNQHFFTEIRSGDNSSSDAKQTVMPGSLYGDGTGYDVSVWWDSKGRIARTTGDITQTTPRIVTFDWLIRAIAFGTVLYLIKPQWQPGTRQNTALKLLGWLARLVDESSAMNNSEQLSREVRCPIDSDEIAEALIELICSATADEEARMRKRVFKDARQKLSRNPDAHIPGWPALKQLLGEEIVHALRAVCVPGIDTSILMKLIEQYVYNKGSDNYIDRVAFKTSQERFEFPTDWLQRTHRPDTIMIGGKPKEAFKSFEMSKMRLMVQEADLYPIKPPGEIFRLSRAKGMVPDEFDGDDSHLVFNTWRGWDNKPSHNVSSSLLDECGDKLDKVLAWLTCDRKEQIEWIKEWMAWTLQYPGDKQQIAWAVVGGQGVGKSFIGNTFCHAIFGRAHGMVSSKSIGERFSISPFIGKMFVFADEVQFKSRQAVDELKLLIRNVRTHGELKGVDARDYNIYARLMFAANRMDIRIGEEGVADRAIFFTKAYSPESMTKTQSAFAEWAVTLKPFFDEFAAFLKRPDVIEHYLHMFMHMQLDRHRIEDIKRSSSRDPDIVKHNLSAPQRVAKIIIESGWLIEYMDISQPFTDRQFIEAVGNLIKSTGENTRPNYVLDLFERLGMLEGITVKGAGMQRFKWLSGTLAREFGEAIGVPMEHQLPLGPGDYGPNTNTGDKVIPWKSGRSKF